MSKGRFVGLCLRFAEDFEASLDDWKPNTNDTAIMNLCVVSEGTYEVRDSFYCLSSFERGQWQSKGRVNVAMAQGGTFS